MRLIITWSHWHSSVCSRTYKICKNRRMWNTFTSVIYWLCCVVNLNLFFLKSTFQKTFEDQNLRDDWTRRLILQEQVISNRHSWRLFTFLGCHLFWKQRVQTTWLCCLFHCTALVSSKHTNDQTNAVFLVFLKWFSCICHQNKSHWSFIKGKVIPLKMMRITELDEFNQVMPRTLRDAIL